MNTTQQTTWRELLGKLTERPEERQRVARALDVSTLTVTRWVRGETEPRANNLRNLPDVFPEHRELFAALLLADYFPFASPRALAPSSPARREPEALGGAEAPVPAEYLARAVAAYASTSGPFRVWNIRNLSLQQAMKQLDPDRLGMDLTVVQCVPGGTVRSLCEIMGVGTAPWDAGVGRRLLFLGAESLAGWTVGRCEPGVVQDMEQKQGPLPFRPGLHEKSAAAYPFLREGKLAGCLLAISNQVDYFLPERLSILEVYANLLALSFRDDEFYELRRIALHEMPILSQQEEYTSLIQFRERVRRMRREHEYRLPEIEAELLVLRDMEAELLRVHAEK